MRGLEQTIWSQWLGVVMFAIHANVNCTTGFTPFFLMFGREPTIPLHTIVGLPQPEELELQDFVQTQTLAITIQLTFV